jgi:hypothetical protein
MSNSRIVKRMTMENLPMSQARLDLEALANSVLADVQSIKSSVTLFDIFNAIKELNEKQDLFIFQDGTVSATTQGMEAWA